MSIVPGAQTATPEANDEPSTAAPKSELLMLLSEDALAEVTGGDPDPGGVPGYA